MTTPISELFANKRDPQLIFECLIYSPYGKFRESRRKILGILFNKMINWSQKPIDADVFTWILQDIRNDIHAVMKNATRLHFARWYYGRPLMTKEELLQIIAVYAPGIPNAYGLWRNPERQILLHGFLSGRIKLDTGVNVD